MTGDLRSSLEDYRNRIDARLQSVLPNALAGQTALDAALRDGVLAPGKRLRPLMTVIAAEDLGGDPNAAIDAGCAVEMVHAASLVLDDLPCMDDARLRRGLPAIHVGHGQDVALLVSIGTLAASYQLLAGIAALSADARLECVSILSRAVGVRGLVGGQFEDLRGGRSRRAVVQIAEANGRKTGSLFSAAMEIGGVVAGVDRDVRTRMRAFAEELGHAFQLVDDLLDATPDAADLGKDVGQDLGKSTIVSIVGRPAVRRRIERHVAAAHEDLDAIFGKRSRMHGLVEFVFDKTLRAALDGDRYPPASPDERPVMTEAQELRVR